MKLTLAARLAEIPYWIRGEQHESIPQSPLAIIWPSCYERPLVGWIARTLRDALSRAAVLRYEAIPQPYRACVLMHCSGHEIVLDCHDHPDLINQDALKASSIYIKLQYSGPYSDPRIIPGGYPVSSYQFYRYYRDFRKLRKIHNITGRFGLTFQAEIRRKAMDILERTPKSNCKGRVRYSLFLKESAQSKLCLHMPGNGPFTYRVAEFTGLGTCMLSQQFTTELPTPLIPGTHYVEIAPDLSDLRDKIDYYLAHDDEREQIAAAGREYFDNALNANKLARYYVEQIGALTAQVDYASEEKLAPRHPRDNVSGPSP